MSDIQSVISDLSMAPGVKGVAIVTTDGLMVSELLGERFTDDVVAGLTSFLLTTTWRCLSEGNMGRMHRCEIHSTHGKVLLSEVEKSWLVVLMDQFADVELAKPEIDDCTQHLRRLTKVDAS